MGRVNAATRYGNHAMETLINDIIAMGGVRSRFEVKIFGGGHVIDSSLAIGQKNVEFAEQYLANEGMATAAKHVGGFHPRRIHYFTSRKPAGCRCCSCGADPTPQCSRRSSNSSAGSPSSPSRAASICSRRRRWEARFACSWSTIRR